LKGLVHTCLSSELNARGGLSQSRRVVSFRGGSDTASNLTLMDVASQQKC